MTRSGTRGHRRDRGGARRWPAECGQRCRPCLRSLCSPPKQQARLAVWLGRPPRFACALDLQQARLSIGRCHAGLRSTSSGAIRPGAGCLPETEMDMSPAGNSRTSSRPTALPARGVDTSTLAGSGFRRRHTPRTVLHLPVPALSAGTGPIASACRDEAPAHITAGWRAGCHEPPPREAHLGTAL